LKKSIQIVSGQGIKYSNETGGLMLTNTFIHGM